MTDQEIRQSLIEDPYYQHWKSRCPAWRYAGLPGLLVEHGRWFERGLAPPRKGGWRRVQKSCYRNAIENVRTGPTRFVYAEGLVHGRLGWLSHAWFLERTRPEIALDTTPGREEGDEIYYGVAVRWDYLLRKKLPEEFWEPALEEFPWPQDGPAIYTGRIPVETVLEPL